MPQDFGSLDDIVLNICNLHEQIAFVRGQELNAEMTAYLSCMEPSLEARKRAGKYAAVVYTTELWKLEAELQSLIEKKFYLLRLESAGRNAD